MNPCLLWLRRDLRLSDHPALLSAIARGGPVIPVFILDPETEATGAAHRWRLEASLRDLGPRLAEKGAPLVLRRGPALEVLRALIAETGADAVYWSRLYDPAARKRDEAVKAALKADGIEARSHNGALLFEPWTVETGAGGYYKVYTPYWRAVSGRDAAEPQAAPGRIPGPQKPPASDTLEALDMAADMRRGAAALAAAHRVGEDAARDRMEAFLHDKVNAYAEMRDRLDRDGCSGMSDHLAVGEISARTLWHGAQAAHARSGGAGTETYLKELVWREFAHHLIHHTPHIATRNWREDWDAFPWRADNDDAERWRRGLTGEPVIDAAMRQIYATGRMHNRARMLVASHLCKHLMTDWRVGEAWFADVLTDWDPASNAMGWQWAAGSGPDAAPFFRIFNPATQAEKFDPRGAYRDRWLKGDGARAFFDAAPKSWGLSPQQPFPKPIVNLKEGRERALAAYKAMGGA
jgi:deoxyribodipyrimidine photo-lyase